MDKSAALTAKRTLERVFEPLRPARQASGMPTSRLVKLPRNFPADLATVGRGECVACAAQSAIATATARLSLLCIRGPDDDSLARGRRHPRGSGASGGGGNRSGRMSTWRVPSPSLRCGSLRSHVHTRTRQGGPSQSHFTTSK